jgi:hypothetical protein
MCIGMSRRFPFDYFSSRSCRVKEQLAGISLDGYLLHPSTLALCFGNRNLLLILHAMIEAQAPPSHRSIFSDGLDRACHVHRHVSVMSIAIATVIHHPFKISFIANHRVVEVAEICHRETGWSRSSFVQHLSPQG